MIPFHIIRKKAVFPIITLLLIISTCVRGQAPSITVPNEITFTQGITRGPVQIVNSGGAVPSRIYGQPLEVTGVPERLRLIVRISDGTFYGVGTYGIFRISPGGGSSLYAGNSTSGYVDGPLLSARFGPINSLVADASGNLYLTETNQSDGINSRIRKISVDGTVSTFASGLRDPRGIAIDAAGSIYVTEASWIRKYSPSGTYTIFAGKLGPGYENGQGTNASFSWPDKLAFDPAGNLYVTEGYYGLRKITPEGVVTTYSTVSHLGTSIVVDAAGNTYLNSNNGTIYKMFPNRAPVVLVDYGAGGVLMHDDELYYTGNGNKLYRMPMLGYGIEPALPQGIVLKEDGSISGTPAYPGGPYNYTVTAYNSSGISQATTQITTLVQPVAPIVTSFTPDSAIGGQWITIKGSYFYGATEVKIGGVSAQPFHVYDFGSITAMMSPGTPSGEITVTNAYGSGSLPGFKLIPPPVVTSFTPETAPQGSVVTITGENFSSAHGVTFGDFGAASFTVVSPTKILAKPGVGSSGTVTVHSPAGTGSKGGFVFISPPEIISFTPDGGAGSEIFIQGTGFLGATKVTFGGTDAASFTVISDAGIRAIVGTGASGVVSVTCPGGVATKSGFTWVQPPVITAFYPSSARQGDQVVIQGSNLQNVKSVSFGGIPASYNASSPTAIFAYVGVGASGDITISTPGGSASVGGFTFLPPPAITSFAPASGRKGDIITITGRNFKPGASVTFGGFFAESVTVVSATTIEAVVGSGASGTVTVSDATGSSVLNGFVYTGPAITGIFPLTGGTGTSVNISGHNFTDINAIYFGGLPAASFTINSPESITAVTGTGQTGKVSIDGVYGIALSSMNFQHAGPEISYLSINQGYAGATVIIEGARFAGATSVTFGGIAASFTVISDNRIAAVLGSDGADGNVVVESPAGTATKRGFTYMYPPLIASYNPASGGSNQVITITGSNFEKVSVKIGGVPIYPVQYSPTVIQVPVPLKAIDGDLTVSTPAGTATAGPFYHTGPKIQGVTPAEAIAGQEIVISGENLDGVTSVSFGPHPASSFSLISSTQIKAIVPVSAGNDVEVRNARGYSSLPGFSVINPPLIFSFNPLKGGAGTPVSISGANFRYVKSVSFGGAPAQSFVVESPEKITAIPAEGASGAIEVVTNAGTASYAGFTWFPKPLITSFSPAKAATGDILTITGTNLNGATSVKFGSIASGGYNATSPTMISVLVPYGESGDITVTTPGGTTSIAGFTHLPAPAITGYTKSGEGEYKTVRISGTNFLGANGVTFGGVAANSFTVESENEIIAIVGPDAIGTITVTTPGGAAQKKGFLFQEPPYINTFLPESGPVGASMTITGSNFNLTASGNKVYFGTISATVISATENELVVIVPAGIANELIRVLNLSTKLNGFSERRFSLTYPQTNPVPANLFSSNTELLLQDQPVGGVDMVDFDGDSRKDLIVPIAGPTNSSSLAIFRNDVKQGIAPASFADMLRVGTRNYALGDVNADGSTDIVYSSGKHIILLKNVSLTGSISFEPDTLGIGFNPYQSQELSIKDIDMDGKNDIVTTAGFFRNISTFLTGKPITFIKIAAPIPENVSEPSVADISRLARSDFQHYTVLVADLDGDQRPDIIQQDLNSTAVAVLRNEHTSGKLSLASFSRPLTFYFEGPWGTIHTFGDIDGDAMIDMTSINQSGIRVYKNVSSPGIFKWEEKTPFNIGSFPGSVSLSAPLIGDLDGDGKPELVIINGTNYKIVILHSNPALAPQVTSFSPAAAPAGATVTVTGKNLLSTTSVSFGGQPAASFRVTSSTSLTAVVGAGASGVVSVINHADTALKSGFTFIPQPEIISFSPAIAPSGRTVTITGKNFKNVTAVSFGGTPASSFTVISDNRITAIVGSGNSGDVSVLSNAETASKPGFSFFIPSPVINSFSPAAAGSGTTVTISGENFTGVSAVNFGGTPAASFTLLSPTSIGAVLGAGASGDLSVVTEGGTGVKSTFTFIPAPVISSFSPAAAIEGTLITITGENLSGTDALSFGGIPAASFTVLSPETITAVAGKGASGAISIKAPGGSASKSGFIFLPLPVITADGQTTFVTGGRVVLNAAPSSGYTYNWTRNGLIIPGATSASITVTQSGSYAASIELNSVKCNSNAIDVKAVYVLPASNFKVQAIGESCKAGENGAVNITAEQSADYTVTIKGNNKDAAYKFSASYEIQNLTAGTYQLCITVAGQPDFSRCFEVIITEPKDLSLFSHVDISRKMVSLSMEGSALFHIELNGKVYETSGSGIELPLISGRNHLEVWTDKDCQGKISRIIELDPVQMVFPNPVESTLNIRAGNNKPAIIEIRDMKSRLIYSGRHESRDGLYKVDVRTLAPGVYLLQTQIENRIENFRIIKQ